MIQAPNLSRIRSRACTLCEIKRVPQERKGLTPPSSGNSDGSKHSYSSDTTSSNSLHFFGDSRHPLWLFKPMSMAPDDNNPWSIRLNQSFDTIIAHINIGSITAKSNQFTRLLI